MTNGKKILLAIGAWVVTISGLHARLNVNWPAMLNDYLPPAQRKFNVAFIPVTCHLACPVTDYISKFSKAGQIFLPRMFQGFPEIKEALVSNRMQAAFIVAPLAIALKAQGVPIKIVYLGHRYGSAFVVQKNGPIKSWLKANRLASNLAQRRKSHMAICQLSVSVDDFLFFVQDGHATKA